jgi:hypothetical protein
MERAKISFRVASIRCLSGRLLLPKRLSKRGVFCPGPHIKKWKAEDGQLRKRRAVSELDSDYELT